MKNKILFLLFFSNIAYGVPMSRMTGSIISNGTGVLKATSGVISQDATTDDLLEGSNQYFTGLRAQSAISASLPLTYSSGVVSCQSSNASQAGCLSSSDWSAFNNKINSINYAPSTPSRSLNTNFTPSASKAVWVSYTIEISCVATILGGQTGSVELRSDADATPTTVRALVSNTNAVSLAIAITATNTQRSQLSYLVPIGHNVRLVSSGNASISIVGQSEVELTLNQ